MGKEERTDEAQVVVAPLPGFPPASRELAIQAAEAAGYRKVITCQQCEYASPSNEGTGKFKCDKPPMSMVLHRGNWFCDDAIERKPRKRKVTRQDVQQAQEHEIRATYLRRMAGADE